MAIGCAWRLFYSDMHSSPSQNERTPLHTQMALAAQGLRGVEQGQSAREIVAAWPPSPAKPGAQALLYHTLRHWGQARALVAQLAQRKPHPQAQALLAVALALLLPQAVSDAPAALPSYQPFTVVDQTVQAVRSHKRLAAQAGFVNACLRRFLREQDRLLALIHTDPAVRWNHPRWWVQALQDDHADWQAILAANNTRAPLTLRVNTAQGTRDAYLARLRDAGIEAWPVLEAGIELAKPQDVHTLPGYAQGAFSVQDAAAQLAAPLLLGGLQATPEQQGQPGQMLRVLDACAAPGGKTSHLLEWAASHRLPLDVLALDVDAGRCARITQNLLRLGWGAALEAGKASAQGLENAAEPSAAPPDSPTAEGMPMDARPAAAAPPTSTTSDTTWRAALRVAVQTGDAAQPEAWRPRWLGEHGLLDALLLDAPCSASGIVRRHPDIRWLRRPQDIDALARTQALLLARLWPLLRPGGRLLYCTCSVFHREGREPIRQFLHTHADAALLGDMLQLLPTSGAPSAGDPAGENHDGFFYALLEKKA